MKVCLAYSLSGSVVTVHTGIESQGIEEGNSGEHVKVRELRKRIQEGT